jgi:WD40 repeat protein
VSSRILGYFPAIVLLVACSSQPQQPTLQATSTPTQTPSPTSTNTPTLTITPTPTPLPMAGPVTENVMTRLGKGWVNDLTFSPNGKILSVASSIGVYLYQVETMQLIAFLPGNAFVKDTVFIDDETLVVGSKDGATTVWNIKETPKIMEILKRSDLVVALGVTEEKSILIVELGGSGASGSVNVIIWDRTNPENAKKVSSEYVFDGEYSSAKNILALSTWMENVILVDTQRMRTTATVCRKCFSFALSQNGDLFAANQWLGGSNYQMMLIDTTSQKEIAKFSDGGSPLAFSPDGKLLVSSSTTGLNFWNVETFELVNIFNGESALTAAFSPDGSLLASVSRDGNLVLRETINGNTMFVIQGFTSLGKTLFQDTYMTSMYGYESMSVLDSASGGGGFYSLDRKTIYFRDISTGEVIRKIEPSDEEKNELGVLTSISFSPDGRILASTWDNWSSRNRTTLLLNAETGERLKTLSGFVPIAFSSNRLMLATSSLSKLKL